MHELENALIGESAHAAPSHILEGLTEDLVHRELAGAPHTIYQEVWHIGFWLQMSLDWMGGLETAYPTRTTDPFPSEAQTEAESWERLRERVLRGIYESASIARQGERFGVEIRCTSWGGAPVRTMTVREQLESLAAHDAYHFGRIVLMRQLFGAWPPKVGESS